MNEAMMDVEEVAKFLGVSIRHIQSLRSKGKMPEPMKLGASVRWSREAIEKWATGRSGRPTAPQEWKPSLRDVFAAHAMQALIGLKLGESREEIAEESYKMADAMIKASVSKS